MDNVLLRNFLFLLKDGITFVSNWCLEQNMFWMNIRSITNVKQISPTPSFCERKPTYDNSHCGLIRQLLILYKLITNFFYKSIKYFLIFFWKISIFLILASICNAFMAVYKKSSLFQTGIPGSWNGTWKVRFAPNLIFRLIYQL